MDLEARIREKQNAQIYDRFELSNPREEEAIRKYVAKVRQSPYGGSIRAIIPMSNAHISRADGMLKGAVYVTDGSTPAHVLMATKDLCGGVSVYRISDVSTGGARIDDFLRSKIATVGDAPGWCDASLNLDNLMFQGPSFGDINCSWGVFKSITNQETLDEVWHIVVRSYHAQSSRALYAMIHDNPSMTLKDVYESKDYLLCLANSDISRNATAAVIAKHLGVKLEEPFGMEMIGGSKAVVAVPMETNRYNFIQRITNFNGMLVYAYYFGCYGFAEPRSKAIIYGMDRSKGYEILHYGSKVPATFGTVEYGYGFPMGAPPEPIGNAVQRKIGELTRWGSSMVYHPKAIDGIHQDAYHRSSHGAMVFKSLGITQDMRSLRLVRKGLYISSPDPRSMTIQEIIEWSGPNVTTVAIPKEHEFIQSSLLHGYMCLYRKKKTLKLIGDVVSSENEHVFIISVAMVKELIAVCQS